MRFVSNSSNLNCGNYRDAQEAIGAAKEIVVDGHRRMANAQSYIVAQAVPIQFSPVDLTQADIDAATANLHWSGLPTEGDHTTLISPAEFGRIGVWDSEKWQNNHKLTDDERKEGEQMMLSSPSYGKDFIRVDVTAAKAVSAPWGSYDKTHHNKIPLVAEDLGLVSEAIDYERATKNRTSVLIALSEKLTETEQPVGEVVAA